MLDMYCKTLHIVQHCQASDSILSTSAASAHNQPNRSVSRDIAAHLEDTRLPLYALDGVSRPDGEVLLHQDGLGCLQHALGEQAASQWRSGNGLVKHIAIMDSTHCRNHASIVCHLLISSQHNPMVHWQSVKEGTVYKEPKDP